MIFAPPRTRGAAIAAGVAALGIALGIALLVHGYTLRVSFAALLSYTAGAVLLGGAVPLAYWAYAVATLRYELAGGAVRIHWGLVEHVVPLHEVERVVLGRHLRVPDVSGLRLPGVAIGTGYVSRVGRTALYLRYRGPEDILYLVVANGAIGLSLPDVQPFVKALQQAQRESPTRQTTAGLSRHGLTRLGLPADRRAVGLGVLALVLTWLTAAVVYARYQGRPSALTLHFPATEAAHLGPRSALVHIPEAAIAWFAVVAVLAVLLFQRARIASYLLLAGAAISGALFLVAAIGATG